MPNNRRGFGGVEYIYGEDANENYWESMRANHWPTDPTAVPVGGLWRDGTSMKVVAPSDTELLSNPGFNASTLTNWTVGGSITASLSTYADTFVEGTKSLYASFPNTGEYVYQAVNLTAGKRYVVSCAVYLASGQATLSVKNATTDQIMGMEIVTETDEWHNVWFDFVASTTTSYQIRLGNSITAGNVIYFDDVRLREVLMT